MRLIGYRPSALFQFQVRGWIIHRPTDHDVEREHDSIFIRLALADIDRVRKITWPKQHDTFFRAARNPRRVIGIHFGIRWQENSRAGPRVFEYRRPTIRRRLHIKDTAEKTIRI